MSAESECHCERCGYDYSGGRCDNVGGQIDVGMVWRSGYYVVLQHPQHLRNRAGETAIVAFEIEERCDDDSVQTGAVQWGCDRQQKTTQQHHPSAGF